MNISTHYCNFFAILFLGLLQAQAQSQFAGTYYGELDEAIVVRGQTVQPREKVSNIVATVTDSGNLTITGISEVRGMVDADGLISITDNGGYGFETGTITNNTINMNGESVKDNGIRIDEYWIVATRNTPVTSIFPDAQAERNNWNYVPWFGYFNGADFPWIYHQSLKSVYCTGTESDLWLFYPPLQWVYTNRDSYPWFYSPSVNSWIFYDTSIETPEWFFNQRTGAWFSESNG
ncbi:hypothetical protein [Rubellicoccus peritrichatus]|uniref:Uncharacterized protein n=1 Tax=Rubellicoccus peritrichatus TaxID=3080537 RepID=A0AAQ3LB81_9BACT|nr:hypothetical protein [Puniceicoccus sp. CR14]WOO41334.1 hypothetical protein RZN69_22170 [Puniceicoccus sp. CR14]